MKLDPPVVDLTNPCYSPTLNGDAYLAGLASELSNPPRSRDQYLASFLARLLYPARNGDTEFAGWPLKHPHSTFCDELLSQRSEDSSGSGLRHLKRIHSTIASPADIIPVKRDSALLYGFEDFFHDSNTQSFKRRRLSDPCDFSHAPSSTSATFSDLRASSKHAPSSNLSINQSSFEVTKADKFPQYHLAGIGVDGSSSALDIFPDEERGTPELELDVTLGYDDSDENTSEWILKDLRADTLPSRRRRYSTAIEQLAVAAEGLVPGYKLHDKLDQLGAQSVQAVADALGLDGHFNKDTLALFLDLDIERLDLSQSLADQNGLNIGRRDVLQVLRNPAAFASLHEINLDSAPLHDYDLVCLQQLPALARLSLSYTGIGDEAIFHLVALRPTLNTLFANGNPAISDDAVAALAMMDKLHALGLENTSVSIVGLRRLVSAIHHRSDTQNGAVIGFVLTVPEPCKEYLSDLPNKYLIDPPEPLITCSSACAALSVAALKRNLIQHTSVLRASRDGGEVDDGGIAYEDEIWASDVEQLIKGSKKVLVRRLVKLLETRAADLAVWGLVGREDGAEAEEIEDESVEEEEEGYSTSPDATEYSTVEPSEEEQD